MAKRYVRALPSWSGDDAEYGFYRDSEKKDTLVVADTTDESYLGMSSVEQYYFVNPLEYYPKKRKYYNSPGNELYALSFGAYGWTRLLVYASSLEDALEEAAGWLADFAPGHLSDLSEEYKDALKEATEELGEDADEEELQAKAQEIAETDMTYTESGWLTSHEWNGGEVNGPLEAAAAYAAGALVAAQNNNYDMTAALPLGKGNADPVELEEADILKMYADEKLGLTMQDVERITSADEGETVDFGGFRLERVG